MEVLDLSRNKIKEIKGFERLSNLKDLNFYLNEISEIKGLNNLKNLELLDFACCNIREIKGLNSLMNLEHLYLNSNEISEIKGLDALKNLKILNVSGNEIKEIKGLETLTELLELYLGENEMEGPGNRITSITSLDNLHWLYLLNASNNPIVKINLSEQIKEHIFELFLVSCEISNINEIEGLDGFPNLWHLDLSDNNIDTLKDFDKFPNLSHLYLYENPMKNLKGIEKLKNLSSLYINPEDLHDLPRKIIEKFEEYFRLAEILRINSQKVARYYKKQRLKEEMKKEMYELYIREKSRQEQETINLEEINKVIDEFEVKIRGFIEDQLKKHYMDDWWEIGIPENVKIGIVQKLTKVKKEEPHREFKKMDFCDFGDYKLIIFRKKNWKIFSQFFPNKGIQYAFDRLIKIRNAIRHARSYREDLTKCKTYISDILKYLPK